jgi:fructose-1,6-bisphosphatase/inositol monophosphatase family enzyme
VPDELIDQVGRVMRQAARTAVLPRFQRLAESDVYEKAPGELVTIADQEAERIIEAALVDLVPGSVVVGEEAVGADAALLDRLRGGGGVWLVDPVDGTANFAAGRSPFVMMVALLREGAIEAGWILDPLADTLMTARRGRGVHLDGRRVHTAPDARADSAGPRGVVTGKYLPEPMRTEVPRRAAGLGAVLPGQGCAGFEYLAILDGAQDYTLFWKTLPWDHAAGALFTEEAGGVVRRLDGSAYDPTDDNRGLLAASSEPIWRQVRDTLFP